MRFGRIGEVNIYSIRGYWKFNEKVENGQAAMWQTRTFVIVRTGDTEDPGLVSKPVGLT
jgi:hypothetical protein